MSPCQALIMCFHFMSGLRQSYTCWIGEFTFDCFIHNVCRTLDRSIVLKIPRQIQKHCNIKNKKLSGKDYFYLTRTTKKRNKIITWYSCKGFVVTLSVPPAFDYFAIVEINAKSSRLQYLEELALWFF